MAESTRPEDRRTAEDLITLALPFSGRGIRLGITGIPGVGKSTLINALGSLAVVAGYRVAVLATDPSSSRSGGSILGDKTRMEELSRTDNAFIRPTPSGGHLGGVARMARETIVLCEAAGHDLVMIETVGVGQSEFEVDQMTDLNLLLMIPGAGDDLQGIKRGIMESADVIVLTKAGDEKDQKLTTARNDLGNAIPFLPKRESGRHPAVLLTDAVAGKGMNELLQHVLALNAADLSSGYLRDRRKAQDLHWMQRAFQQGLMQQLQRDPSYLAKEEELRNSVENGELSPFLAARMLLESIRKDDALRP